MPTQQGPVPKSASPSWYRSSRTSDPNQKPSTPLHSTNHHILLVISLPWLQQTSAAGACLIWNFIKSHLNAVTSLIYRFTALAVQWNYLGSNKKPPVSGSQPQAADIIGVNLGIRLLKFSRRLRGAARAEHHVPNWRSDLTWLS